MRNIHFLLFIALFSCISTSGCSQEPTDTSVVKIYESCCGAEPVEFTYGDAYMYVPNVFTPNGDGINDFFVPFFNEGILGFDAYLIYTTLGDTLVYASVGFDPNNIANTAWKGLKKDGSVYSGAFKYQFIVALKAGGLFKVEGNACRIECGPDAKVFQSKTGCFYPSQTNGSGHLDPSISSNEIDCFH